MTLSVVVNVGDARSLPFTRDPTSQSRTPIDYSCRLVCDLLYISLKTIYLYVAAKTSERLGIQYVSHGKYPRRSLLDVFGCARAVRSFRLNSGELMADFVCVF